MYLFYLFDLVICICLSQVFEMAGHFCRMLDSPLALTNQYPFLQFCKMLSSKDKEGDIVVRT